MRLFLLLKTRFLNMKIRRKVLITFLFIGVLPFICYIIFSNRFTNQIIMERENELTKNALSQAVMTVENELETYNNLSNYMFNNPSILRVLNTTYDKNYFKMYKAYQDTIEPLFLTYYALHPDLLKITIYSTCDLHPYNNYVQKLSALSNLEWFPLVRDCYTSTWTIWEENGEYSLYSTRLIGDIRQYKNTNYLCLQVDYDALFEPLTQITRDDYEIVITDAADNLVFSTAPIQEEKLSSILHMDDNNTSYMLLKDNITTTGWTVNYYSSSRNIINNVNRITSTIYAFGWIILLFLGIMVFIISALIIAPIETLTTKIREVRHGDMSQLAVQLDIHRQDEIGQLFRNFSRMMEQIHHYIEINLRSELEKKNYQQKILSAQINPHFLYNSLSLINSRAILSEQDEISNIVILLSTFYRTALNRGKDMTILEKELLNIQSYIQIQLLSYSEPIDVIYDIDYSLRNLPFPNFILQPFVENALDHGLKNCDRPDKKLSISVDSEPNNTIPDSTQTKISDFITVRIQDNGIGMDEETTASLFQIQTSGYGMKNVNDRLHLLYGSAYSLIINSTPGQGTLVKLKIPVIP